MGLCFMCRQSIDDSGNSFNGEGRAFEFLCQLFNFQSALDFEKNLGQIQNSHFCINCASKIREAVLVCTQLKFLQEQLDQIKLELQNTIILAYQFTLVNSTACTLSAADCMGKLLCQCWSPCKVMVPVIEDVRKNKLSQPMKMETSGVFDGEMTSTCEEIIQIELEVCDEMDDNVSDEPLHSDFLSETDGAIGNGAGYKANEDLVKVEITSLKRKRGRPMLPAHLKKLRRSRTEIPQKSESVEESNTQGKANRLLDTSCKICSKTFASRNLLKAHSTDEHGIDILNLCRFCGHNFTQNRVGPPEKPFKCPLTECERYFATLQDVRVHHHAKCPDNPRVQQYSARQYKCDQCEKAYCLASHLRDHVASIHDRTFKFCCELCGQGFQHSSSLEKHKKYVHSTQKSHECDHCGRKFKRPEQLMYHQRQHRGVLPHVCDECGKGFAKKSLMMNHKRNKHSTESFPCPRCGKIFPSHHYLHNHIQSFHNRNPKYLSKSAKEKETKSMYPAHQIPDKKDPAASEVAYEPFVGLLSGPDSRHIMPAGVCNNEVSGSVLPSTSSLNVEHYL